MDFAVRLKRKDAKGAKMDEPSAEQNGLARAVVDSALIVHGTLGPGLPESAYEQCLAFGLASRTIEVRRRVVPSIICRGHPIEAGYRIDMIADEMIVVEVKATEKPLPIQGVQLDTCLKLSVYRLGRLPVGIADQFQCPVEQEWHSPPDWVPLAVRLCVFAFQGHKPRPRNERNRTH